jgi:hypothetical protein
MPKEGDTPSDTDDVGGGLEKTPGVSKKNYRPGWAKTFKRVKVKGARPSRYKALHKWLERLTKELEHDRFHGESGYEKKTAYYFGAPEGVLVDFVSAEFLEGTPAEDRPGASVSSLAIVHMAEVEALAELGGTLSELAEWRLPTMAREILSKAAEDDQALVDPGSVDRDYEGLSLWEIAEAAPRALQGLSPEAEELLAVLDVNTVADLASWGVDQVAAQILAE